MLDKTRRCFRRPTRGCSSRRRAASLQKLHRILLFHSSVRRFDTVAFTQNPPGGAGGRVDGWTKLSLVMVRLSEPSSYVCSWVSGLCLPGHAQAERKAVKIGGAGVVDLSSPDFLRQSFFVGLIARPCDQKAGVVRLKAELHRRRARTDADIFFF